MISLERHLTSRREQGFKLLVPYVTAGVRDDWVDIVHALVDAGADAVEIGIPFSDPVMDGPVIQAASVEALERGTTPKQVLDLLIGSQFEVPLAVMTYYNLVFRFGHDAFATALVAAGISGAILPDLPIDEAGDWLVAADAAGVETVMLVAPNTRDDRMRMLCDRARGFIYGVATMGVTGERASLAATASSVGDRLKAATSKPVLLGIGISNAEQATEASAHADGVIIGAAVMRRVLEGQSPVEIAKFFSEIRSALNS